MNDETFVREFETGRFTMAQWHHREHIKIGYVYLRRYSFEAALARLHEKLEALNEVHQVPAHPHRGYHETMTVAWLVLVAAILEEYGPEATSDEFCEKHPELLEKTALRLFYSRDLIMSAQAKREFVQPDLASLPGRRRKQEEAAADL